MLAKTAAITGLSVVFTLAVSLSAAVISTEQIEADWFRQHELRSPGLYGGQRRVSVESDAAGGCDGVIDGEWGFHTENEVEPWWQVDLGESVALGRVVLYNRTELAARASRIIVMVSDDGKDFEQVYQHGGDRHQYKRLHIIRKLQHCFYVIIIKSTDDHRAQSQGFRLER